MEHMRMKVEAVTVVTMDITRCMIGPCGFPTSTLGRKAMDDVEQGLKNRARIAKLIKITLAFAAYPLSCSIIASRRFEHNLLYYVSGVSGGDRQFGEQSGLCARVPALSKTSCSGSCDPICSFPQEPVSCTR